MRMIRKALFISLLLLLASLFQQSAHAWLPKKKPSAADVAAEKVRTYQPPPVNAMEEYCEPLRLQVVALDQLPFYAKPFVLPKRGILAYKHQKCKTSLLDQEYEYLKHAGIQQSPSLPKLKTDSAPATAPASKEGKP